MIHAGDKVTIRPEWCDSAAESIVIFEAVDDESCGRVVIRPVESSLVIRPTQTVETRMLQDA